MSEPDPVFWASKLHFYISGIAFYNFPYLFGYLFSNAVYLQRAESGAIFSSATSHCCATLTECARKRW